MNNKFIKITLFTLICSLTTANVYLASENIEFDTPQEQPAQNNNTLLKVTAAGLTVASVILGLIALRQKNEILAHNSDRENAISGRRSLEREKNSLSTDLRKKEDKITKLEREIAHKVKTQNQAKDFLLKLKDDLVNPFDTYTVNDIKRISKEYEKQYWELYKLRKELDYNNPKLREQCEKEKVLLATSQSLDTAIDRLLKEYNPSVAGEIKRILTQLEQPDDRFYIS